MSGEADDRRLMAAALRLARHHLGRTSSNPSVGCLIVRDGVIVGRGVTAAGGRPHAETQALAEAGDRVAGATAYVTLEPCSHHGHTPPCVDALVAARIGRVVASVDDPDPRVSGRGFAMLEAAGIPVTRHVLEAEGRQLLAGYLTRQTKGRPHVTLKLAVSADGMIGRLGEGQVAITGAVSRRQVHVLRAESDAILVGTGTALADDPLLDVRLPGLEALSPHRFVLGTAALPPSVKLVQSAGSVPLTTASIGPPGQATPGIEHWQMPSLEALLARMASQGMSSLLIEGGARTAEQFLAAGLVDRMLLFQSELVIGAGGIASPVTLAKIPADLHLVRTDVFGTDRCHSYEREI